LIILCNFLDENEFHLQRGNPDFVSKTNIQFSRFHLTSLLQSTLKSDTKFIFQLTAMQGAHQANFANASCLVKERPVNLTKPMGFEPGSS